MKSLLPARVNEKRKIASSLSSSGRQTVTVAYITELHEKKEVQVLQPLIPSN